METGPLIAFSAIKLPLNGSGIFMSCTRNPLPLKQTPPCSHFSSTPVSKRAMLHIFPGTHWLHRTRSPIPQAAHHRPPLVSCCISLGSCGFFALEATVVDGTSFSFTSLACMKTESPERPFTFPSSLQRKQTNVVPVKCAVLTMLRIVYSTGHYS